MRQITYNFKTIIALLGLMFLVSCSNSSNDEVEELIEEDNSVETPNSTECTLGKIYNEANGIVRVDIEDNTPIASGWISSTLLSGYTGKNYIIWGGNDSFNEPGLGLMKFSIKINTPGTYQFVWNSRIGNGTSNTEHNDSWLRIKADDFYGEKDGTGQRVYPKGSGKTPNPEGTSKDNWLKVYMNKVGEWFWRSSTNDKDPFNVYAKFNSAGVYDIEISGRSKSHAIDQFVLYKTDKTLTQAIVAKFSEITCK